MTSLCSSDLLMNTTGGSGRIQLGMYNSSIWNQNQTITIQFLNTGLDSNGNTVFKIKKFTLYQTEWNKPHDLVFDQYVLNKGSERSNFINCPNYDSTKFDINATLSKLSPKERFTKIITDRIQPLVNLKFKFLTPDEINNGQKGMIRILFDSKNINESQVGKSALYVKETEPTMKLGTDNCGTWVHEMLHALGAIHEHQNPRDNPIEFIPEQVYAAYMNNPRDVVKRNILDKYSVDQINGTEYDPNSIMIYALPGYTMKSGIEIKKNYVLSISDIAFLMATYPRYDLKSGISWKDKYLSLMKTAEKIYNNYYVNFVTDNNPSMIDVNSITNNNIISPINNSGDSNNSVNSNNNSVNSNNNSVNNNNNSVNSNNYSKKNSKDSDDNTKVMMVVGLIAVIVIIITIVYNKNK